MNCTEAKYLMPLYESGELDARAMAEFEQHMQQCSACQRGAESIKLFDDALRDAFAQDELDARALRLRVLQQMELPESSWRRIFSSRLNQRLALAAVLVAVLSAGVIYLMLGRGSLNIYRVALRDHIQEVVQHERASRWVVEPDLMAALMTRQLGETGLAERLAPTGFRLDRARVCRLSGSAFVHLVYKGPQGEVSFYLRPNRDELPGQVIETVNGCDLHAESDGQYKVAGFHSEKYTVLVVGELPETENLRIARDAAANIA